MNAIEMKSPIGKLTLLEDGGALVGLYMEMHAPPAAERRQSLLLERAKQQLQEYFAGQRDTFHLPLRPMGTEFQRSVWQALNEIPFGETRSYADIARRIGRPKAVRAVGAANGANPISIVIPCHRVIGADGSLTGYGGGLPRKKWLLRHEGPGFRRHHPPDFQRGQMSIAASSIAPGPTIVPGPLAFIAPAKA